MYFNIICPNFCIFVGVTCSVTMEDMNFLLHSSH